MNDLRFTGIILVILVILTIPALAAEKKEFVATIGSDGIR